MYLTSLDLEWSILKAIATQNEKEVASVDIRTPNGSSFEKRSGRLSSN